MSNIIWYHLYVESKKKRYKWTYLQNGNIILAPLRRKALYHLNPSSFLHSQSAFASHNPCSFVLQHVSWIFLCFQPPWLVVLFTPSQERSWHWPWLNSALLKSPTIPLILHPRLPSCLLVLTRNLLSAHACPLFCPGPSVHTAPPTWPRMSLRVRVAAAAE